MYFTKIENIKFCISCYALPRQGLEMKVIIIKKWNNKESISHDAAKGSIKDTFASIFVSNLMLASFKFQSLISSLEEWMLLRSQCAGVARATVGKDVKTLISHNPITWMLIRGWGRWWLFLSGSNQVSAILSCDLSIHTWLFRERRMRTDYEIRWGLFRQVIDTCSSHCSETARKMWLQRHLRSFHSFKMMPLLRKYVRAIYCNISRL